MMPRLLFPDRDFRPGDGVPAAAETVARDLDLEPVFDRMAAGDPYVRDVARRAVLTSETSLDVLRWRHAAFEDCRNHPGVLEELYAIAVEAIARERSAWGFGDSPGSLLFRGTRRLSYLSASLRSLRQLADARGSGFRSPAFAGFFARIAAELTDAYLEQIATHRRRLEFDEGTWMSARLGTENRGTQYVLRRAPDDRGGWWARRRQRRAPTAFEISERDESGLRALSDLRDRGLASVARALARSDDHLLAFFHTLRAETAFYRAELALESALRARGLRTAIPSPHDEPDGPWSGEGLYDPALALRSNAPIFGNALAADGRRMIVITGANQGGKTTFLRALGSAQLFLQAGMIVPGRQYRAPVAPTIVSHFAREEDATMTSGKLDEELGRLSRLMDSVRPGTLLLSNESFASTNEREGSEIGLGVFRACATASVRVALVTHLYELARSLAEFGPPAPVFLRAERAPDGRRTFRMVAGAPEPTGFGADVFRAVFGAEPGPDAAPASAP